MSVNAISLRNLSKVLDGCNGHRVRASTAIDLNASDGEFLCITRPSGCRRKPCGPTLPSDAPVTRIA
jgi:hypothetical protein